VLSSDFHEQTRGGPLSADEKGRDGGSQNRNLTTSDLATFSLLGRKTWSFTITLMVLRFAGLHESQFSAFFSWYSSISRLCSVSKLALSRQSLINN